MLTRNVKKVEAGREDLVMIKRGTIGGEKRVSTTKRGKKTLDCSSGLEKEKRRGSRQLDRVKGCLPLLKKNHQRQKWKKRGSNSYLLRSKNVKTKVTQRQ